MYIHVHVYTVRVKKTCHTVVMKDCLYGALLQKNGPATVSQRSTPLCAAAAVPSKRSCAKIDNARV